ncbi:MAG: LPS export ABC transporter permease LptG [Candidatus Omnitrophica bacterium]|nr:LPS export ABC transporter permease LptG [Candidatus Omnitrophota bacterium]MDD5653222.1 LPS export ABC transporter permease LptG [Candidatus Omnitrophota bacterium]
MRILDRYIIKSVLSLFVTCLLVFLFLYVIIDLFSNLEDMLKQQLNFQILLQYYMSYLPIIFVQVTPIAILLATLYTFGKLNRDNEIIAMRASGLSILQITRTVIIFGFLTSIFIFWVNDRFVPQALGTNQRIREEMENADKRNKNKQAETIYNLSMYGSKNRLFFVSKFIPPQNTMEGITILENDEHQNITKKIVANKGVFQDGFWKFYQVITYTFNDSLQTEEEPQYFEEEIMPIPETPHEFMTQRERPDLMTIAQLDDYIWKLSKSGATTVIRNLKVDLYQRFSAPFTSIVIIFLGIPFALKMRKRATGLSSLGLSMIMGFLFYVLNAVSIAFGKAGILIPLLSASLPQILAFIFSLYFIYTLP